MPLDVAYIVGGLIVGLVIGCLAGGSVAERTLRRAGLVRPTPTPVVRPHRPPMRRPRATEPISWKRG